MGEQIMTDVQLAELHDDIRDGVSMIVAVDHYYHLTQQRDDLLVALERLLNYHYHNHMGPKPKEYHAAKAAIAATQPSNTSVQPIKSGTNR